MLELVDRIIVVDAGKVVLDGPKAAVLAALAGARPAAPAAPAGAPATAAATASGDRPQAGQTREAVAA